MILAEAKRGDAEINNRSWVDEEQTIPEILKRLGLFPADQVTSVATMIKDNHWSYREGQYRIRAFALCRARQEPHLVASVPLPLDQQLTWRDDILPFIYQRFNTFQRPKSYNSWKDLSGDRLFDCAKNRNQAEFVALALDGMTVRSERGG